MLCLSSVFTLQKIHKYEIKTSTRAPKEEEEEENFLFRAVLGGSGSSVQKSMCCLCQRSSLHQKSLVGQVRARQHDLPLLRGRGRGGAW